VHVPSFAEVAIGDGAGYLDFFQICALAVRSVDVF
jgi:hypothetical protein